VSELRAILQNASAGRSVGIEMLNAMGSADSECYGLLARWQREQRGMDSPRAAISSEQVPESRWVRARRLRAERDAGAVRADRTG